MRRSWSSFSGARPARIPTWRCGRRVRWRWDYCATNRRPRSPWPRSLRRRKPLPFGRRPPPRGASWHRRFRPMHCGCCWRAFWMRRCGPPMRKTSLRPCRADMPSLECRWAEIHRSLRPRPPWRSPSRRSPCGSMPPSAIQPGWRRPSPNCTKQSRLGRCGCSPWRAGCT